MRFSATFHVSSHLVIPWTAYQYMEFVLDGGFTEWQMKEGFCFWCGAKFTSPCPLGWHGSVIAFFCGYVSPYLVVEPVATRSDLHEAFTFIVVRQVKIGFVSNHRRVFDHVIEAQLATRVSFLAPYCVKVAL